MTYKAYAYTDLVLLSHVDASNGDLLRRQIDTVIFGLAASRTEGELDWSTFKLTVARDEYYPDQLLIEARIVIQEPDEEEN